MSVRIDDLVVTVKQLFGYEQAAKRIADLRLTQDTGNKSTGSNEASRYGIK